MWRPERDSPPSSFFISQTILPIPARSPKNTRENPDHEMAIDGRPYSADLVSATHSDPPHNIYIPIPTITAQMMPGIGTDVVVITRFKGKTLDHDRHFLERIFTPAELAACFSRGDPAPHLAARFAGKEAVTKALCSIGFDPIAMNKIEITNAPSGVPSVTLICRNASMVTVLVSLSHDGDIAVACAVAMEGDGWKKDLNRE